MEPATSPADPSLVLGRRGRDSASDRGHRIRLDVEYCPAARSRNRCGCGIRVQIWTPTPSICSGRRSRADSISSTPSACSSKPSAGPPRKPATRQARTDGPGCCWPLTPNCAWLADSRATSADHGRNPLPHNNSPQHASAGYFGTYARTSPALPAHRNPHVPAPADQQAAAISGPHPATTVHIKTASNIRAPTPAAPRPRRLG